MAAADQVLAVIGKVDAAVRDSIANWQGLGADLGRLIGGADNKARVEAINNLNHNAIELWRQRGYALAHGEARAPDAQARLDKWVAAGETHAQTLKEVGGYAGEVKFQRIIADTVVASAKDARAAAAEAASVVKTAALPLAIAVVAVVVAFVWWRAT